MNHPKVSVIVPVYNVEKYLQRCLDSIIEQSFSEYELILIDDGSTDDSLNICLKYASLDSRIRLFKNENKGISFTRDFGIQNASGDYILFVDSDDWIESDMLEIMYTLAKKKDADIVGCSFYLVSNNFKKHIHCYYDSRDQFLRDVIQNNWGTVWKILTKRSVYYKNNIHFPKGVNGGEDYIVCVQLLYYANRVISIKNPLYNYFRDNSLSITHNFSIEKIIDQIKATEIVERFLSEHGELENYKKELHIRKFLSKYPLLYKNPIMWCKTFPECNYMYKELKLSKLSKIIISILCIFNRH